MDKTRMISTVVIWLAATVIFVGGFARMSWSGLGGLIWLLGVAALFGGAGFATKCVWKSEKWSDGNMSDRDDALQADATDDASRRR